MYVKKCPTRRFETMPETGFYGKEIEKNEKTCNLRIRLSVISEFFMQPSSFILSVPS
jgi:hypothetical protein